MYALRYDRMFVTVEKVKGLILHLDFSAVTTDARARPTGATNKGFFCYFADRPGLRSDSISGLLLHVSSPTSLSPLRSVSCLFCSFVQAGVAKRQPNEEGFKRGDEEKLRQGPRLPSFSHG